MSGPLERLRAAVSERYSVERELGAGGMATVYLADDLKHGRKVAVKVLRPELAAALGPGELYPVPKTPHLGSFWNSEVGDGITTAVQQGV